MIRKCLPTALSLLVLALAARPAIAGPSQTSADKADSRTGPRGKKDGEPRDGKLKAETFTGLAFRSIGPAINSGRVADIAIHPSDRRTWYVAAASGNLWKTANAGITWTPVFDGEGSYSIGCVTVDPRDPLTVWVGTGENNSQRSVAYGDGLYKSIDGGKSWTNVGLKASEHIARIVIDPRDSRVVYVAAQGPLWASGGDRGLYKTLDGGTTWEQVLKPSDDTGVTDFLLDPRDPDLVIAAAYQRRRHVWTLIDGGPESGLHKSTDGGKTWRKLDKGLPKEEMGRIGLAQSPADPNVVYAVIEAAGKDSGFYRSLDRGENWEKMSDTSTASPQYYQEIIADPKKVDRIYLMDTWMQVSEDGGKTFARVGEKSKHVDNHALWIDPDQTDHLIAGCDGGLYDSFDRGATWRFYANLPITQFYKVAVDNVEPFYNVYGGTQDNNTLGGPSRTTNGHGIRNSDWFVTVGGDGYQSQVDPGNPNIVYSMYQYGGLVRHDRLSGEVLDIQPQPGPDEPPLRWNWDSPLLLSPHSPTRLYFAAQKVFRSDDRGGSWQAVSPDLTRQIDRNKLKVMGRVWSVDAVAKNASTSFYGNLVALAESPRVAGLLYTGSDDGLIQVSRDGGATWTRHERFPGVPDMSYVSRVVPSRHADGVVYATFDNHKMGDFKPYVLRSDDYGASWKSVTGDLPGRGTVYALVEDHVKPDLLFAGSEFGVFFTPDGGKRWLQLKGGLPTIQARDLAIQRRETDLVVGTFGRGFYILDDYTPLREVSPETLDREATLYPVKPAWMYIPSLPLGGRDKSQQGDAYYAAPNPPFGAIFTYYLKDEIKARAELRREAEKDKVKKGEELAYPAWETLRAEDREEAPAVLLTVRDEDGNVVRRLVGPVKAGFQRVAWDLRLPTATPTALKPPPDDPFRDPDQGPLAVPGRYTVSLAKRVNGETTELGAPQTFEAAPLSAASLPARDRAALHAFQRKTARLQRAVLGAAEVVREAQTRVDHLKKALLDTPAANPGLAVETRAIEQRLKDIGVALNGDSTVARRNEPTLPGIVDRVQQVVSGHWSATSDPTDTHRRNYDIAAAQFQDLLPRLRALVKDDLQQLESRAEAAGAPWTPGRIPDWAPEP